MNEVNFILKPFPSSAPLPEIQITGKVQRKSNIFSICYQVSGNIAQIYVPAPKTVISRQRELWETTCLEFFLGIKNSPRYWEFNLSPSGDWNIYRFTDYRQGMEEEKAIASLPFQVNQESHLFQLDLELDLAPMMELDTELDLGITAVIQSQQGEISYWGLTHCGTQPDFHLRDSFVVSTLVSLPQVSHLDG
ncbi:DOMON-like domain-containing protein [Merismopedia glauca]|uniref:DOMON-like domain-containing protein n=1 Tax=Merismopedia glauca CCAP 1448/3 TaxID=1296344 RepID=A0A2T1C6N2_9CYAN|nr:DOMON-like domain-containing protein [Merismopedia glauca]PSB03797.1 hypothetical protein C7B64_06705 [Merismopedia glauca CCAP 1448/3]